LSKRRLPTFIGIGGHKCASTWLSACMREHPEIFMSEPKEIGFFSWHFDKGMVWYLKHFNGSGKFQQAGEFTSHYLYDKEVPDRILSSVGKVKLLAVVRDPVNRSLSQIKYGIRTGFIHGPANSEIKLIELHEMIQEYPAIVERSFYAEGLKRFCDVMGEDSILVLNQTDCNKNPAAILGKVWDFLGVNKEFKPSYSDKKVSPGIVPRWGAAETWRVKLFLFVNRHAPKVITLVRGLGIAEIYRKLNAGPTIMFNEDCKEYLKALFEEDWDRTESYMWRPSNR